MERRQRELGDLWRGDWGTFREGIWETLGEEICCFFPCFPGNARTGQIRADVKLISDREYPLLNVSVLYKWIKMSREKHLDCADPQETA